MLELADQVIRHAQIDGRDVAYSVVGDGPPLLIGGWWCSHLALNWQDPAFRDYISRLARHHTVVRYDQPGRGASAPDSDPPTDLEHETAIVRGLVDLHDGTLKAVSSPGEGTTVTVLLPLNGPETKKAETAEVTQITPREPVVARKSEWPDEVRRAL